MRLEQVNRRLYFREAPYSIKDKLAASGANWDPLQKAWYVGTQKRARAEALLEELSGTKEPETVKETDVVLKGRATYQGSTYYVLWSGLNKDGEIVAKLCYRDGSKIFWARGEGLTIEKTYKRPTSIADLKAFAERKAREQKTGVCECRCHQRTDCHCPNFCHYHHDGCDACGCEA